MSAQLHGDGGSNGKGNDSDLALTVREIVWRAFEDLPPKGKPDASKEYSVLAGLVAIESQRVSSLETSRKSNGMRLLCLSTGNRSVGFKRDDLTQTALCTVDCHAEVLARKGFQSLLLDAVAARLKSPVSADPVEPVDWLLRPCPPQRTETHDADATVPGRPQFELNPDWKLFLYVSQVPCGDCAVSIRAAPPAQDDSLSNNAAVVSQSRKRSRESSEEKSELVEPGTPNGAPNRPPATEASGIGAHRILWDEEKQLSIICEHHSTMDMVSGVLRHKPGKGPPSFCMSCSDKLLLWQSVGWQGVLLSPFFGKPVTLSGLIVDQGAPVEKDSLSRGLVHRGTKLGQAHPLSVYICPLKGDEDKSKTWKLVSRQDQLQGCGSALVAVEPPSGTNSPVPGSVGRRVFAINTKDGTSLGLTKKLYRSTAHALPFSRWSLATRVRALIAIAMSNAAVPSSLATETLQAEAIEGLPTTYKSLKAWCAEHSQLVFQEVDVDLGQRSEDTTHTLNSIPVTRSYAAQKERLRADPLLHDWVRKNRADFSLSKDLV